MHSESLNTVVFSGGRGTKYIQDSLSGVENTKTTYLINGYDSGLSTGEVRRSVDGLLGPSDFRKAIANLSVFGPSGGKSDIGELLEHRLPNNFDKANDLVTRWINERNILSFVETVNPNIPLGAAMEISETVLIFLDHLQNSNSIGSFDPSDLAIGNAYLAGAYLDKGSFQSSIDVAQKLAGVPHNISIVNVTEGDDVWLVASTNSNQLCVEEGYFVTHKPPGKISELFLVPRQVYFSMRSKFSKWETATIEELKSMQENRVSPIASQKALDAIEKANLIIYGTGTLNSSLLPSYMTYGITEAIAGNYKAQKILMINGKRDIDLHDSLQREDAIKLTLNYLSGLSNDELSCVSEIWTTGRGWDDVVADTISGESRFGKIPIVEMPGVQGESYGVSSSYRAISSAISRTIGSRLAPSSFVSSIVIPVFNESHKIEGVLAEIEKFSKSSNGSLLEFIFVDGGSTDGTWEILSNFPGLVLIKQSEPSRQAAIFEGIQAARGLVVGVFHADLEYSFPSFMVLLENAERNSNSMFIGSRSHGAGGESNLRRVYGSKNSNYWISRFGGLLVAGFLSARIGRVISDPLSGIYATSKEILIKTSPQRGEADAYVSIIRSCSNLGVPIVEMGVAYVPRTKDDGKKTKVSHGLRAIRRSLF